MNIRKCGVYFIVTCEIEIGPVTVSLSVVLVHSDIHFSIIILQVLTGHFLACVRHSCLLCQLCLQHCFETVFGKCTNIVPTHLY